jgi:hypothetical protein
MASAKHGAGCGMTLEQIKAELLDGRDLDRKGNIAAINGIRVKLTKHPDFNFSFKMGLLVRLLRRRSPTVLVGSDNCEKRPLFD